jgi:hypothetical protein
VALALRVLIHQEARNPATLSQPRDEQIRLSNSEQLQTGKRGHIGMLPPERMPPMAKCSRCGADTQMYSSGVPICISCSDIFTVKPKPSAKDTGVFLTIRVYA